MNRYYPSTDERQNFREISVKQFRSDTSSDGKRLFLEFSQLLV
jgi:hypothetical protein